MFYSKRRFGRLSSVHFQALMMKERQFYLFLIVATLFLLNGVLLFYHR